MYLLIDPPVSPFSPPDEIVAWIARLEKLAEQPENREKNVRKQIREALSEARSYLRTSNRLEAALQARRGAVPHQPV
jgi:hypothetical protein